MSSVREGVEEAAACLGVIAAAARTSSLLHLKGYTSQPGWRPEGGAGGGEGRREQRLPPVKESTHRHRGVRECDLSE